jgi:hypothetical protein
MSRPATEPCPVCGAPVEQIKCKVVCTRCRCVVSNCNGD